MRETIPVSRDSPLDLARRLDALLDAGLIDGAADLCRADPLRLALVQPQFPALAAAEVLSPYPHSFPKYPCYFYSFTFMNNIVFNLFILNSIKSYTR